MNRPMPQTRRTAPGAGRARHTIAAVLLAVTVVLVASGCTTVESGTAAVGSVPGAAGTPTDDGTQPAQNPAPATAGKDVDVCSLLTDSEVKAIIGTNSGPKGGVGECAWENQDNYHSVTIDIGRAGSAVNGKLPDPLPGAKTSAGPNGIRFSSGNVAEFLIGDRACQVQVVTSVTDESDRPAQVKVIGLIRSRVKG